jgi:hypothetical protein
MMLYQLLFSSAFQTCFPAAHPLSVAVQLQHLYLSSSAGELKIQSSSLLPTDFVLYVTFHASARDILASLLYFRFYFRTGLFVPVPHSFA